MNTLLPFQFHHLPVRGRILKLHGLSAHIPSLQQATACTQTLTELLAAAALLAHDTKHSLAVTLQIQHETLGALLFAHAGLGEHPTLKAYANEAAQGTPFTSLTTTAGGLFAITMENESLDHRYQSFVPLEGTSAASCLAAYFAQSVQTPTLLTVFGNTEHATALMLQALPATGDEAPVSEDDWTRLTLLLQTLTAEEALNPETPPETLLMRLFAEDDISTFTPETLSFETQNPRPKMLAALASLPKAELDDLIALGTITLTDNATGQTVTFTADELMHLQDEPTQN